MRGCAGCWWRTRRARSCSPDAGANGELSASRSSLRASAPQRHTGYVLETWGPLLVTAGAVVAVLIVLIAFWRLVARFISDSAGWPELARRFPAGTRPT